MRVLHSSSKPATAVNDFREKIKGEISIGKKQIMVENEDQTPDKFNKSSIDERG